MMTTRCSSSNDDGFLIHLSSDTYSTLSSSDTNSTLEPCRSRDLLPQLLPLFLCLLFSHNLHVPHDLLSQFPLLLLQSRLLLVFRLEPMSLRLDRSTLAQLHLAATLILDGELLLLHLLLLLDHLTVT